MNSNFRIKQKQILVEHYLRSEEAKSMLTIYEAIVINILASYIGDGRSNNNECWEEQKELARSCYMSLRKLRDTLKSLEEKEIIKIRRTKHRNYYSFNEFWVSEVEHYSLHCFAAESFVATKRKISPALRASSPAPRADHTIYNNINNNRQSYPQVKEWDGLASTAKKASDLLEDFMGKK